MHLAMLSTAGLMCEADREDAWYHPPDAARPSLLRPKTQMRCV